MNSTTRLDSVLATARERLLAARTTEGCWEGHLSGNPFSTAAAVIALSQVERSRPQFGVAKLREKITSALNWLTASVNADGGWGDVPQGKSNLMATVCCWAALADAAEDDQAYRAPAQAAERYLKPHGDLTCAALSTLLVKELGDSVLASSILTLCALAGRFGEGLEAWKSIPAMPFEQAALPRSWSSESCLTTLDSALPVLIAAGQLVHLRHPTGNPLRRPFRDFAIARTLKLLQKFQVEGGGILESIPVTSIVLASMAGAGRISHLISKPCMEFLVRSQRADGSWAVTTDISVSLTSLALDALVSPEYSLRATDAHAWLLDQQFHTANPVSGAPAGGWGWTNAPGGAPNSHDTAATLLALWRIRTAIAVPRSEKRYEAAIAGLNWLIEAQNSDGGVATFSKGAEKSTFGGGSADLTAQSIRAWLAWRPECPSLRSKLDSAVELAIAFLKKSQGADGSWLPLWFANEQKNPIYGTSRAVLALVDLSADPARKQAVAEMLQRGVQWLLTAQLADGGWSGQAGSPASLEETAWAIQALAAAATDVSTAEIQRALGRSVDWLAVKIESRRALEPIPLGQFYSRIRYTEQLHPLIWTVAALSAVPRQ